MSITHIYLFLSTVNASVLTRTSVTCSLSMVMQTYAPDVAEKAAINFSELCQSISTTKATWTQYQNSTINWLLDIQSALSIYFILQKLTWKSWIMSWTAIESRRLICSNLGWALLYPQPTAFQLFSLNSLNTALPRSPVAPVIKTRLLGISTSS